MGVLIAHKKISDLWGKATHATTFGGNPLVTAAGWAAVKIVREEGLLANVRKQSRILFKELSLLQKKYPFVRDVRGKGLMIGMELDRPGTPVVQAAMKRGLLINCTQERILRLYPALTVRQQEINQAVGMLDAALGCVAP